MVENRRFESAVVASVDFGILEEFFGFDAPLKFFDAEEVVVFSIGFAASRTTGGAGDGVGTTTRADDLVAEGGFA